MLLAYYSNRTREADDKRLWAALRSGRQEALEELFRCYHKQLYNYGLKMSGDRELVQEAIQQLFLNLWKRRFDPSTHYWWPIQQSQLDLNPNLEQNPGY